MVLRAGGAVKEKGGIPEQKEKTHPAWAEQAETRCVLVLEGRKLCWNGWSRARDPQEAGAFFKNNGKEWARTA